jgi:hypothetical protein
MAGINDALHFDKLPPDVIERAKRLRADLGPRSVSERLKFYVSETPWGFFRRDDAKESSDLPVRRLADELSHECELIVEHLPDLLNGTQRNIYPFGEQLGKVIEDPQRLLNSAFEVLKISDPKDANPAFVGAVLAGLEKRDSRLVESTLDQIASEPSLFRYLVDVTIFINIQTRDLKRITTALEAGHLDISTIRKLAYGQALHAVGPDAVKELLTTLLRLEREATWVGLEIATFYLHILPSAYSLLRESIISMLSTPRLLAAGGEAQLDEYHFKELAERVLNDGDEEFARHLATEIVAIARLRSYPYSLDHVLQPLVLILLSPRYQAAVWPVFETAISEAKGIELFHFEHMLGKGLDHFGDGIGPIFIMGDEQLLAWCRKKPEKAPAFLARVAPLLKTDADKRTWTPLIEALLDEFGDQDAVLSAISANLGTFGWSGSLVPYYEQFIEPLSSLTNHPRKKVREFARRQLSSFQQAIFEETARDQERDFGIYH